MNRSQVKMVAWLMVASLVAAVVAGLLSSSGDDGEPTQVARSSLNTEAPTVEPAEAAAQLPAGPHVLAYMCTGQDCPQPTDEQLAAVETLLSSDQRVASWEFVPKEAAYQLFLDNNADNEDFAASLTEDDVPAFFTIDVYDAAAVQGLVEDLQAVDSISVAVDNLVPSGT